MQIDGRTAVLVHLSCPSTHLRTPQLFNQHTARRKINAVLVPWQVTPDHLAANVAALRRAESVAGLLVTIPHKESAARLCDRLEGVAAALGAANVIRREDDGTLTGRNLDGVGFVAGLRREGVALAGARVLIAGAGGVALAIAAALIEAGVAALSVTNRTRARAEAMVGKLDDLARAAGLSPRLAVTGPGDGGAELAAHDLLVNATALGMHEGDALPFDAAAIRPGMTVAEAVMAPRITALLRAAEDRGAKIVPGEAMLSDQIDPFIDFVLAGRTEPGSWPPPPGAAAGPDRNTGPEGAPARSA